jgi:hypothetical protein
LISWIGQAESVLNLPPAVRKKMLKRLEFRAELSHLLYICQLEFWIAWVQEDPAKIVISRTVKV